MRFEKILPAEALRPYIKYFVLSELADESSYKVFPSAGMVMGFQYRGRLAVMDGQAAQQLATAGITGIFDRYKVFSNAANVGTVLVYFTATGFAHFAAQPANVLFNESISLADIFDRNKVHEVQEKLALALTDQQRVQTINHFLLAQLKDVNADQLIIEAVQRIEQSKGAIRIKELHSQLLISQSAFEKRFRKVVGTSPKKFAAIARFNAVLTQLGSTRSLTEIGYANNYFDQAHFIHDFKQFTGDTPERFKRLL